MSKKVHMVGASVRMKCDTTGTVSFNPIAMDNIPVEIRTTFIDRKPIFSDLALCSLSVTGTYLLLR